LPVQLQRNMNCGRKASDAESQGRSSAFFRFALPMTTMQKLLLALCLPAFVWAADPALGVDSSAARTKARLKAKVKAKAKGQTKANGLAVAARDYFGRQLQPSPGPARIYGGYARGCVAGARMLPTDGPSWQVMRLSRNRNWGHPALIDFIERFSRSAQQDGWPGMLVGDMAQPMGGPMSSGHASHQIGIDVDFWLNPMPDRTYTAQERENISAVSMLAPSGQTVDPGIWSANHAKLLRRAVSYPEVARIFVHPAIKKALCDGAGNDKSWLHKVHPWWGHHYHFHVRLRCPSDSPECENQKDTGNGDGCGAELDKWLKLIKPPPKEDSKPAKGKPPLTLAQLPAACTAMLKQAGALEAGKTAGAVQTTPEKKN
jgi:penicillin-insensitive murein endopeptidase